MAVAVVGHSENPALAQVIGQAASVELQRHGLLASLESNPGTDESTARAEAARLKADFLLLVTYTQAAARVDIALSLRGVSNAATIGSSNRSLPFDLNLDSDVSGSVRALLAEPAVQQALRNIPKTEKQASPGGVPAEPAKTQHAEAPLRMLRFAWSLTGAPLLLVGSASNYFRYGADVSMFTGVTLPRPELTFQGGALAGVVQLFPAAGLSQGRVYSFLGGLQFRLVTAEGPPIRLFASASGGAAVILVLPGAGGVEAKTDPFAGGGLGASLRIFRSVALGVELGLLTVFEERYPIIAVAPSLTVGISR